MNEVLCSKKENFKPNGTHYNRLSLSLSLSLFPILSLATCLLIVKIPM